MTLSELQISALRAIEDADGRITPAQVVDAARAKDHPLHSLFEWDKAKAARAQWIQTARYVIGAYEYVVVTTTATVKAPFYVRDPDAKGQGYRSTVRLREDPVAARQSLVGVLEIAAGHVRRAYDLATPLGLDAEVDALLTQIVGLQRVLKSEAA